MSLSTIQPSSKSIGKEGTVISFEMSVFERVNQRMVPVYIIEGPSEEKAQEPFVKKTTEKNSLLLSRILNLLVNLKYPEKKN